MEIKWLGHACFKITHKGYSVVIDPYNSDYTTGFPRLKISADMVLVSHEHYGHNFREGVKLSGKSEALCPFDISTMEVFHDSVCGIMRGKSLVHILEADGIKLVHMGDIGGPLTDSEKLRLFGADAVMITAGGCRGLPAQEVWRLTEEIFPNVIIPMHYRDGKRGNRRMEHLDALINLYEAPDMVHYYDTDTISIDENTEPQIAVLKYQE